MTEEKLAGMEESKTASESSELPSEPRVEPVAEPVPEPTVPEPLSEQPETSQPLEADQKPPEQAPPQVKEVIKEVIKEVPVEKVVEKVVEKIVPRELTPEELDQKMKGRLGELRTRARQAKEAKKQERLNKILAYISEHGRITNREARKLLRGISEASITNYFNDLERAGKIVQIGRSGRGVYYTLKI